MTDKKFTDEEKIISNLTEVLIGAMDGYSAYLENGGITGKNQEQFIELLADGINLINRQKAEIDGAKAKIEICAEVIKRQDAEIKRLKECPKSVYEYDGETMEYCVRRKSDDKLFQFYAGTGKIMGFENKRCIHSLIRLLDDMRKKDEGKCQK